MIREGVAVEGIREVMWEIRVLEMELVNGRGGKEARNMIGNIEHLRFRLVLDTQCPLGNRRPGHPLL